MAAGKNPVRRWLALAQPAAGQQIALALPSSTRFLTKDEPTADFEFVVGETIRRLHKSLSS